MQLHLAVLATGAEKIQNAEQDSRLEALQAENESQQTRLDDARREQQDLTALVERLQADLAEQRSEIRRQAEDDERRPPIRNMVGRLPRDASRYVLRNPDDIEYIRRERFWVPRPFSLRDRGSGPSRSPERREEQNDAEWPL